MSLLSLVATLSLDTSKYEQGLTDAEGRAGKFGSALKSGLKTAASVGIKAVAAAGAAVAAVAGASVKAGMNFDSSMSQVAATMGKTMEEMENEVGNTTISINGQVKEFTGNLREFAQVMGANTAFSASQAADALNYMALAGYDAQTSMDMLPTVLNLAAAGGIELAQASDMVTDASSALGLSIEETYTMVDQMAQASSKSNTSVAQLGEAFLSVGGTAKMLSGGTNELSTALGIMADSGIKGSEAGHHMRNILLALNPQTDDAVKAFKELGFSAYDSEGNLRPLNEVFGDLNARLAEFDAQGRQEMITKIFNRTDLAAVDAMLTAAAVDVDTISESLKNSSIEWEKYGAQMGIAKGDIDDLARVTENLVAQGWENDRIVEHLGTLYGLSADDARKALSIVNLEVQKTGNRWSELSGYIADADGAAQDMADTQLDNLQGDITLFKSALEGAEIAISDGLTPTLREFVKFGSDSLSQMTEAFKDGGLDGLMDTFGTALSEGLNKIIEMLPTVIDAGMKLLGALGQGILDNIPQIVDAAVKIVKQLLDGIVQALPLLADGAIQIILELSNGLIEVLPELVPAVVEVILKILDALVENAPMICDAGIQIIFALVEGIINSLPTLLEQAPVILAKWVAVIIENSVKMFEASHKIVEMMAQGIVNNLPKLKEAGLEMFESVKQIIVDKVHEATQWGRDLIGNFISGIKAKWEDLKGAMSGAAGLIGSYMHFSEPDVGPLSDFHTYAPDMMKLFAQGIKDNEHLVTDQIDKSFDFGDQIVGATPSVSGAPVTINVYGAEGQNERDIAEEVMNRLRREYDRGRAVYA